MFLQPLWLLLLAPLALLVWWMLRRRAAATAVPFLALWPKTVQSAARSHRQIKPPPLPVVLALAAMLLAILAAAQPIVGSRGPLVTVIVDRGLRMSDLSGGQPRYAIAAMQAGPAIAKRFPHGEIDLIDVPGGAAGRCGADQLAAAVAALPRTALDTRDLLQSAIARAERSGDQPIVVLTDQPIDAPVSGAPVGGAPASGAPASRAPASRVAAIAPPDADAGLFITAFAVRAAPMPQAMVRIFSHGGPARTTLHIDSGGASTAHSIDAPPSGASADYFVDLPTVGDTAVATVDGVVPGDAQSHAYLAAHFAWPRLAPGAGLPASVDRLIAVYQQLRPPADASPTVAIEPSIDALPIDGPGVALSEPLVRSPATAPTDTPSLEISAEHSQLVAHLDWTAIARQCPPNAPAPAGWTPIVQDGSRALLAVRTQPAPAVWIGFDVDALSDQPAFVVLWDQIFSWLSGATAPEADASNRIFSAKRLDTAPRGSQPTATPDGVDAHAWPGFFRNLDASLTAVDAPDVPWTAPRTESSGDALSALQVGAPRGRNLAEILSAIAAVALCAGVAGWTAQRGG